MRTLAGRWIWGRKQAGLTQAELARQLSISRASVSNIETGETRSLQAETAVNYERVTGISCDWLVTGKGKQRHRLAGASSEVAAQLGRIEAKIAGLPTEVRDKIEADINFLAKLNRQD